MSKIVGIDLGTSTSCLSILEEGKPVVIVNQEGSRTTPSVVAYTKTGDILVGKPAKNQQTTNPTNTVFSAKRFIGKKFSEAKDEIKYVPFKVVSADNGDCKFDVGGKLRAPEEISAQVLMKLKRAAEDYLGESITEAVITVPAYFNDSQRQATKDAGTIAGLDVRRIINEPTAACLAYGLDDNKEKTVAVYDLGGGTFDISVLEFGDGVFEVKSTNGNTRCGGDDIDHILVDYLADTFEKENGIDLRKDSLALQRLKEAAENAKISLSSSTSTDINLPFITADANGPKHLQMTLTKAKFESMISDFVNSTLEPCKNALKDAGLTTSDIDEVILVGGSTRIPLVQEVVEKFFGKKPNKSVNPDECVSCGASIQGGVLSGSVKDVLLLDVTPLSLGIETMGGVMTKLIERNTTVPTSKTQVFSTAADNQTAVTIHVLQGEREMASGNKTLGNFNLDGIPMAPRGVPQIEVKFDVDANGILTVTAKDLGTGKEQHITITGGSGLTDEEINKAVNEAKAHEAEDKKLREKIDAKNEAEGLIFSTRKSLKEYGDRLTDNEKSKVEKAVNDLEEYIKTDHDTEELKKKIQETAEASYVIGQKMYENSQASGNQSGTGSVPPGFEGMFNEAQRQYGQNRGTPPDATDADYEVVD